MKGFWRVALAVGLPLLAAEGAARLWLARLASPQQVLRFGTLEQVAAAAPWMFARHHYLQYGLAPGWSRGPNRHNALGFRGDEVQVPKAAGLFRIALVGGSTTYQTGVEDYKKSYPYLLQQLLAGRPGQQARVEVVNAGVPAYASWESLQNLQFRVLDLQPDLVLIYDALNDVHARLVHPFELYRGDNGGSRVPFAPPREGLLDQSAFLRIARTALGLRSSLPAIGLRRTFEDVPGNHSAEYSRQRASGRYPAGIFARVSAAEMLARNRPVFFERNLRSMVAICRAHAVEPVLMTYAWSREFAREPRASAPEFVAALEEHNQVIREVARATGTACYDHVREMPTDPGLWTDGRHVNEAGSPIMAELVARWLTANGKVPR